MTRTACWLAAFLAVSGPVLAQPPAANWAGKRVVLKRPGIKIGHSTPDGKQIYLAELTALSYPVIAEQEGFLQVEQRGATGWFPKEDALLPDDAIKFFAERVAAVAPTDGTAHAYLGWAYREKRNYPEAIKAYDEAIRRQPAADWFNNRGVLHREMKDFDRAVVDFSEALRLKPEFQLARENRAIANIAGGRTEPALADLNEIVERDPRNAAVLAHRAKILLPKDADAALKDLDKAVELEPKNADFVLQRGDLHAERRQFDKALADYTTAIGLDKNDPDPLIHRAHAYTEQKQHAKAIEDLEAALALAPTNAEAQTSRGWNRFLMGKFAEANREFEAVLKVEPKSAWTLNCQAWLWATCPEEKLRDGKKAEEFARKAVELSEGKEPAYRDTLAAALADQGRFDEAARLQEAVVTELGQEPEAVEARARWELYKKKQPYRQTIEK